MNQSETFDITDGLRVLRRNIFLFSFSTIVCAGIALGIAFSLPKQFKSRAVLNIQTSYFQNPMVNDLITQVSDPQELQSQRMSLLRLALNNEFLDSLATKHNIYTEEVKKSDKAQTLERDQLTKRIQYYSLSPTTFEITVMANDPTIAQQMTSEVLERMKSTLINERFENLSKTKNAIENHVKSLGENSKRIATPVGEVAVQTELQQIEASLSGLLVKFTESHPEVVKLRSKQRALSSQRPGRGKQPSDELIASGGALARQPSQEVYSDLLKKLSYLAIVLDMEKDRDNISYLGVIEQPTLPVQATFPNKKLMLALGLVVGILVGTFLCIIAELGRRSTLSPNQAADIMDAPLLGELPVLTLSLPLGRQMKALPPADDDTEVVSQPNA